MPTRSTSPGATPRVIVPATARDLPFIVALQKRLGHALGFLPRQALAEKIALSQVWVAREGRSAHGFLHHGSLARPEVRVFQIAVGEGSRRGGVATALVEDLLCRAAAAGAAGLSLRCLSGLEANRFWRAAGFRLLTTEPGAKGELNVWVRRLRRRGPGAAGGGSRFAFSSRVHPCPACGRPTVDTWVRGARRLACCPGCVAAAGLN